MVQLPHDIGPGTGTPAPRRAAWQALALIALLLPASVAAAWALATLAGAPRPGAAAGVTAVLTALGAMAILPALRRAESFPHRDLGWCNVVTMARAAGIGAMAGLVLAPAGALGWGLVVLAGVVLALDGLDGWLARRTGMQSRFGARFDVESDVAFALVLAALAVAQGQVGPWFLALGVLRPVFLAAGRVWPALTAPLPEARS
jgi:phosphatidylglycerophosphate synthase